MEIIEASATTSKHELARCFGIDRGEPFGLFYRLKTEGETEEGMWFLDYLDVDQELATRIQIVQKKETPVQMSKRRPPPNDIFCSKRKKGISSFIKLQKQFGDIELTVYETKF